MTYFVESGERRASVEEVQQRGARVATGLVSFGIREGDSVAMLLRNDICLFEAMIGAGLIGAYAVPVNWHWHGDEAGYVVRDCGAKVLIVHADLLPNISGVLPHDVRLIVAPTPPEIAAAYAVEPCGVPDSMTAWDDWVAQFDPWTAPPAASRGSMIYTSGTTGHPKGVRREPAPPDVQERVSRLAVQGFGIRPGANVAMTGPMYHSAPNAYGRLALQLGCNIVLMPRFDPESLLATIACHRITHMHVVPTMFVRLLRLPEEVRATYALSSLEHVIHGAAPCPLEVKQRMIAWWGPVIHEYYGSTEAGLVTVVDSVGWMQRPGTVGRPLPGTEVCICDDDGNELPVGQSGEIYMSLNGLTDFTYHNHHDKREEIARGTLVTNGDIGYLDRDGYLYLNDRKRDMVISGGVNIYPAEIEAVLHDLPGVQDCAVFGIPDDDFGEVLAAAVQCLDGTALDPDDVRAFIRERLAGYKVPRVVTFHDDLPREDTGKIFKRKLRAPYWEKTGRQI